MKIYPVTKLVRMTKAQADRLTKMAKARSSKTLVVSTSEIIRQLIDKND